MGAVMRHLFVMLIAAAVGSILGCASVQHPDPPAGGPDKMIDSRAVEAVIWGSPPVNFPLMHPAMVRDAKAGEGSNKIVFWSKLFGWKNQTLTPNPDAIYFMPFIDTKDA